ncbi:UNVERIFIED_CONTAM: hypothetical protein RMT77_007351 [Armadillidium vulgare]
MFDLTNSILLTLVLDVGVVFTERKESWGGEKLPSETKGGQPFSPSPLPPPPTTTTATSTSVISHISSSSTIQSHDDTRPQKRHERSYSQATNIISTTFQSDNGLSQLSEVDSSIEDSIKPYSERKQFWETVSTQSFETKSPVTKSETESDTDTGTDGTVIEKSKIEKEASIIEQSDSEYDSSQKKDDSVYENVVTYREKPTQEKDSTVVKDLPSPEDISLKDVKTKKEMFEKEIKRQSSELEESLSWKRSSKEYDDDSSSDSPRSSSAFISEKVVLSSDASSISEKQSEKKLSEQKTDEDVLRSMEETQKETTKLTEISKVGKEVYEKTVREDDKTVSEKEVTMKEDTDKETKDDLEKSSFRSLEEKEDGSVVKKKVKETSTAHSSHELSEGKSETVVTSYDKEHEKTSKHTSSSVSTVDFRETSSTNLITSETKVGVKSPIGVASRLSSSETTDSNNDSFERSDSTKESFDKSGSASGTGSSLSKKQSTLTSSADEHELSEFPEDSSRTSEDENNKIVEKKVEEERRKFGDTEELLVREITTTREGDQEQRVIKETKTQETLMPDGSTVKTTSVTTFTTQLDRQDSEDTVDQSEGSTSSVTEKEKSDTLLKQIKADMITDAMHIPADDVSPEHKLLSPEDSKPSEQAQILSSPIHVPEESVQDIVWEVSQEQSDVPISETVQYISDELDQPSGESKVKFEEDTSDKKIVLTEEEARCIAREIVEEVKNEALKRSPIAEKEYIVNRVQFEERTFLPKPSSASAFSTETSSKLEKYIQEQLIDETLDEKHLSLIESVAAKKTEMLRKRIGASEVQLSLEITDEDLKSSEAELSPIETHMERLRQMTEEEELKSGREPSEADESESSMIIHDTSEETFTSGYDQANQMFNKTLDNVKSVSLKGERAISTICEEIEEVEKQSTENAEFSSKEETRKKSREELTEAAIEIVKEITVKAKESDLLKQIAAEPSKEDSDQPIKEGKKSFREDFLKHDKSLEIQMESSMTESVEECSAAESTRAYDSRYSAEVPKIASVQEATDMGTDKKQAEILSPPKDEIRLRKKKTHIDEFNRRSGTDFDAYSSSGESHYFTAAEGTDSRSVSRPCSSDIEALLSGTPGTSEYDTALTSQEGSQYSRISSSSREFSTAPSDISSRDSMKSIDSESSGNLGSIELSEASETLVPSALDLEKDMEIIDKDILEEELLRYEENVHSAIPQLTIQSETPKEEDIPSPFDTETDDLEDETKDEDIPFVSSKMKRSMEMTFHPEPKLLKEEDQDDYAQIGLEESTISDLSVTTVVERDRNILESSGEINMTSSNISDQLISSVETKEASTGYSSSVEGELPTSVASGLRSVTITTTSIPPDHPDQTTVSICTQVTSETVSEKSDDSFFRTSGPAEEKYISLKRDARKYERPADAPMSSDDPEDIGATGGHSVGPDSSYIRSHEPEADQECVRMIREGEELDIMDSEIQHVVDSQPEDELDTDYLRDADPIERPKTPEPGSRSKLRINASQDSEELTEVDKRFSAIFSVTYEEPASPALLTTKEANGNVPDITITEHMAPLDGRLRYPDLECEDEFPECRQNEVEATPHSTPSSVTSPKSSTTDSEHGREYCLESQTEGPVQYSDYGSFEVLEAGDISDVKEYENTILFHERRLRDLTIKEEDEVSSQDSKKDDSPVLLPPIIKAVKLDSESPSSSGDGDIARDIEDPNYNSSIEEQRRWLEMQFEENARKGSEFEYTQQSFSEHVYSGPLEDIEEERDEFERRDLSHVTKTSSLSSTPEYDVLAGRKFFTRSGEQDDVSMSSLQEFEHIEREVAIEQAARRSSSGSQESLNGKRPGSGNKSLHGDDISVSSFSSLNEFERLEKECIMIEQVETKVKTDEKILSEIEEGHESQVSESESCETISDAGRESPDNYEQKIFEIDEIIRQAQTNVEKFEKNGVSLKDIVGISCSTDDRTPSVEPQDSLEEMFPTPKCEKDVTIHKRLPDKMSTSTDSLESKQTKDVLASSSDSLEEKKKPDRMSSSVDSLETDKRDLMATSADSLGRDDSSGRDGDVSSESERITHHQGGAMEWSTDSLEPTSSQATHATYQYETDSVMSGSFTSGCSTTLMPSVDDVSDLMSASMYISEGELPDDAYGACNIGSGSKYEWTKIKPEGIIKETIEESSEPEYSQTITRTVTLPPDVKHVTFTGPGAKEKLEEYIQQFDAGEHISESEALDSAGNVHVEKIVQKRIVIDPAYAEQEGLVLGEPEIEESFVKDSHGNVTRVVRRTVISTHTVEIDLDTGEPIVRRESMGSQDSTHTHSLPTTVTSHPSGPPSGSHSPREPLPTSLEPNTASDPQKKEEKK